MAESPFMAEVQSADTAEQLVHIDVSCLSCGYNLRGLQSDGACPECGAKVADTLDGNLLALGPRRYLSTLSVGLLLIVIAYVASMLWSLVFAGAVLATGVMSAAAGGQAQQLPAPLHIAGSLGGLVIGALSLIGWWMFTEPAPNLVANDRSHGYRQTLRVFVIIFAILMAISLPIELSNALSPSTVTEVLSLLIMLPTVALGIAQFFVSMMYIRQMARRVPDRDMIRRASTYLWLLPVIFIAGSCVIIGPLIATIMYLVLLWSLRSRIETFLRTEPPPHPTM